MADDTKSNLVNKPSHCSSSYDDDDIWEIHEKIQTAFSNVNSSFPLKEKETIIQFWAPTSGRQRLSTSEQPFSLDRRLGKYRLCSIKYQYSIITHVEGNNNNNNKVEEEDDDVVVVVDVKNDLPCSSLINGPVATSFVKRLPEVVKDLRIQKGKGNLLVDCALDCGLTSSMMLPVFSQNSQACVGVVECSMKLTNGLHRALFNELKTALERVGLSISHAQEKSQPHKAMSRVKPPTNEMTSLSSSMIASDKQLGDELQVPQTPKSLKEETNRSVAVKRKFSDLDQTNQEPFEKINNRLYLVIVVLYKENTILFLLPRYSSNVANIMEVINVDFDLDPQTYSLQYESEPEQWYWLYNDSGLDACIKCAYNTSRVISNCVCMCKYE